MWPMAEEEKFTKEEEAEIDAMETVEKNEPIEEEIPDTTEQVQEKEDFQQGVDSVEELERLPPKEKEKYGF